MLRLFSSTSSVYPVKHLPFFLFLRHMVIVVHVISHGLSGLSVQSSLNPCHSSSLRGSDISPEVLISFSSCFSAQIRLGLLPLTSLEDNLWWLKGFNCCFIYLSYPILFFYKCTCSRPYIFHIPVFLKCCPSSCERMVTVLIPSSLLLSLSPHFPLSFFSPSSFVQLQREVLLCCPCQGGSSLSGCQSYLLIAMKSVCSKKGKTEIHSLQLP